MGRCICVRRLPTSDQLGGTLDNRFFQFGTYWPMIMSVTIEHPGVCCLRSSKNPFVHLHETIWLALTSRGFGFTTFHWLMIFAPRNGYNILTTWQTCLGAPRWPHIHCFVMQVCFPLARAYHAGVFDCCICQVGAGIFSYVIIVFLRREDTK